MPEFEPNTTVYTSKKKQSWGIIGISMLFLCVASVSYAVQLSFTQKSLQKEIENRKNEVSTITNEIKQIRNKENVSDLLIATEILNQVEAERVPWSDALREIMNLETENIKITNISTGKNASVAVTGQSKGFSDVSALIKAIQNNKKLVNHFVDSAIEQNKKLSASSESPNETSVQFQLTFSFLDPQK